MIGALLLCASVVVIDGDSLKCFVSDTEMVRVRIHALHAPERRDPGGSEATAALRSLLAAGVLRCEVVSVDRYGRAVADCNVAADLATLMIMTGTVRHCPSYGRPDLVPLPTNGLPLPAYCED